MARLAVVELMAIGHNLPVAESPKTSLKGLVDSETCQAAYGRGSALVEAQSETLEWLLSADHQSLATAWRQSFRLTLLAYRSCKSHNVATSAQPSVRIDQTHLPLAKLQLHHLAVR